MTSTHKKPTHDLYLVVDTFQKGEGDEATTEDVTERVASGWINEAGTFTSFRVSRNRVLLKDDRLKLFLRTETNNKK